MLRNAKEIVFLIILILNLLTAVKPKKTCNETFCGKLRRSPEGYPRYNLDLSTATVENNVLKGTLTSHDGLRTLHLKFAYLTPTTVKLSITDITTSAWFMEVASFFNYATPRQLTLAEATDETIVVTSGRAKAIVYGNSFKIESYFENKLVAIINENGRLVLQDGSAALDITFKSAQQAYGIPLHADNLALRTTTDGKLDPYRLYNQNTEQYQLNSTEALHSSVPIIYTHGLNQSAGIFWFSFSQMWIDVTHGNNRIDTYFMDEKPSIEVLLYNGPTIANVVAQCRESKPSILILPQIFALGYHQSRNSYTNENEVLNVIKKFNKNNLPLESVWLDETHTDNGKYFTWDPIRFPNPINLQKRLASENRSLVVTLGPHIKVEKGYFVHDKASSRRFYVRNPNGSDYVGKGLPGDSGFIDFFNPDAQEYYASLFSLETFNSENLHVFLNLNEPTVLKNEQHEGTLSSDLLHSRKGLSIQHGYLHNMYGGAHASAAFLGLFNLLETKERPFLATHSHSFLELSNGPLITGNNYASWEHLRISFPMCLSEALVNMNMCGANVGGFAGIPDEELYQRWYQAGAWLPFYRAHFAGNVPEREPYMYPEEVQTRVRKAMYQRYAHIPVWYTLFWENIYSFEPVIRPLFYHYPQEEATLTIDNELLLGANILVAPVLKRGVSAISLYLPGGESELWYNINDNYKVFRGVGYQMLHVNLDSVPVFYRGGSIIARKDTPRLTTNATVQDPYTLYVCLNTGNQASGALYVDDYRTISYIGLEYLYIGFSFSNNTLHVYKLEEFPDYDGAAPIGEIVIVSPPKNITKVQLHLNNEVGDVMAKIVYSKRRNVLRLSNLSLSLRKPFKLTLT